MKAVFFDFDGTLADTAPDLLAALNAVAKARGRGPTDAAAAREMVSGGAGALLRLAGIGEDARDEFLKHYAATHYKNTRLFAGARAMLAALKKAGFAVGVVTNKPRAHFAPIAARLGLDGITAVAGGDAPPKPAPDMLHLAAQQCGARRCVYVGDDPRDSRAAAAADMPFFAAGWGYWQSAAWPPDAPVAALCGTPASVAQTAAAFLADD